MGWLRSVGSIKLQVSFAEYSLFYRALLQKRPIILSVLLTVATLHAWELIKMCLTVAPRMHFYIIHDLYIYDLHLLIYVTIGDSISVGADQNIL